MVISDIGLPDGSGLELAPQTVDAAERPRLIAPERLRTLLYQFTVDDPHSFTRRWFGEIAMKKADGPPFEYACHEGNLSMEYILRAARAEERAAEEANRREVR